MSAAAVTWATLEVALLVALAQSPTPYTSVPPNFAVLVPQASNYASGRISRDIVFLASREADTSVVTTTSRTYSLASMSQPIIVLERISIITPKGTTSPAAGVRVPYDAASLDTIDLMWPTEGDIVPPVLNDWTPRMWAMRDASTVVLAPTPGAGYTVENTGMFQPAPLSSTTTTTYIGTNYPELLIAACMVYLSGALLRNYGAAAIDPQMPISWETQYRSLKDGVLGEEMRRRGLLPDIATPGGGGPPGG